MKRALLLSLILVLTLAATAMASGREPILTSDGVFYTVATDEAQRTLVITARYSTRKESVVVPGTIDNIVDSDGRIAYDRVTQTLYVVWRRGESSTDVVFQSLNRDGQWSARTVLASAPGYKHADLKVTLTRTVSLQNEPLGLLHAVWWKESPAELIAEYGLAAVNGQTVYSTAVAELEQLAGIRSILDTGITNEDGSPVKPELVPTYPPLAMAGTKGGAVDVVFGAKDKKTVTRVTVEPRQPKPDVRILIPGGKGGSRTPYVKVHNAMQGQVETTISNGRVVVYSATSQFRYATLDNGTWTPVRAIALDSAVTPEQIAAQLILTAAEQQ